MSHYSVAVITDENTVVDWLLEPYDENADVESYLYRTKEEIIEYTKESKDDWIKRFSDSTKEELIDILTKPYMSDVRELMNCNDDDDFYDFYRNGAYDEDFDDMGNEWATHNPQAKWDWYSIGGRWSGKLYDKVTGEWCDSVRVGDWDMDYEDEDHDAFLSTYAIITPDGEWFAPGEMGWFGMSTETSEQWEKWQNGYKSAIRALNPNWYITIVDCHI